MEKEGLVKQFEVVRSNRKAKQEVVKQLEV